jgi:isoleucyl-tRNA synthetase
MEDLSRWAILTDFRYSYFTSMPAYEANVLDRFADLFDMQMIERGSRPVFWSIKQQRILSEDDFVQQIATKDCLVSKLKITKFGSKAERIKRNYPEAKLLVFSEDAWQLCGA